MFAFFIQGHVFKIQSCCHVYTSSVAFNCIFILLKINIETDFFFCSHDFCFYFDPHVKEEVRTD